MDLKEYKKKDALVLVYTGEGKGKTSASIGLMARSLGSGWSVAFIQFIKTWKVGEHDFIGMIQPTFKEKLYFYKGGKGFYNAGNLSAKDVTEDEHKQAAEATYKEALQCATSGKFDLVICDEINNAVHEGLLPKSKMIHLIEKKHPKTSICLTGRNFPKDVLDKVDIATNMTKIKHHFDEKYLANPGIDY